MQGVRWLAVAAFLVLAAAILLMALDKPAHDGRRPADGSPLIATPSKPPRYAMALPRQQENALLNLAIQNNAFQNRGLATQAGALASIIVDNEDDRNHAVSVAVFQDEAWQWSKPETVAAGSRKAFPLRLATEGALAACLSCKKKDQARVWALQEPDDLLVPLAYDEKEGWSADLVFADAAGVVLENPSTGAKRPANQGVTFLVWNQSAQPITFQAHWQDTDALLAKAEIPPGEERAVRAVYTRLGAHRYACAGPCPGALNEGSLVLR